MAEPKGEERFAYEVVHRILGVAVDHVEQQSHGEGDATMTWPSGETVALEATILGDPAQDRVLDRQEAMGSAGSKVVVDRLLRCWGLCG